MGWRDSFLPSCGVWRKIIEISGKPLEVTCTRPAMAALAKRHRPLVVEMELAFACFARKTVRFHEQPPPCELVYLTDVLAVYAHAVIPDRCETDMTNEPPHAARGFVPKRLWIDFRKGEWRGEFGF